jgi:hypothetical protein
MSPGPASPGASRVPGAALVPVVLAWLVGVGGANWALLQYKQTPGEAGSAPAHWPAEARIAREPGKYTLVMLAHPRCPCTRASVAELGRLMAQFHERISAQVLLLKPAGTSADWSQGPLAEAERIPGVKVQVDEGGMEAERFGARTSGQVVVYDPEGRLVFSGGITPGRGHEGDNAGSAEIAAVVGAGQGSGKSPVYGCALHDPVAQVSASTP